MEVGGKGPIRQIARHQISNLLSPAMTATLPGELVAARHANLKLGPGLLVLSDNLGESSIISTRAGLLKHSANRGKWWVESNSRRVSTNFIETDRVGSDGLLLKYVPAPQEYVVGVVVGRLGEGWRVDIGGPHVATLDGYAFESATKRNKPNLKVILTAQPVFYLG